MLKKLLFLFVFLLGIEVSAIAAKQIEFKASAPDAVVVGQLFKLSYTANGEIKDFRLHDMPEFEVKYGPAQAQSYSQSWVNGKSESHVSYTYTFTVAAKKEGTFVIPGSTAKINGANYTSNSLNIKVLPEDKNSSSASSGNTGVSDGGSSSTVSNDGLFMTMTLSKNNVYEQEGVLVTFKLYSLYDVQPTDIKFPEFEGFLVQEIDLPTQKQWSLDNYKGRNYRSVVLRQMVLYPQHSGKINIKPASMDLEVQIRNQKRIDDPFSSFFDTYRTVNKTIVTSSATVNVKPLPSGKPSSFSGAVGNYSMKSEISTDKLKANEAVTVKISIKGNGNLKLVKNPEVKFPNDFDIYDPKVDTKIETTANGSSGVKNIEYMAIPRYEGDFEIPAIQFSYFDPKQGEYKTLSSGGYKLHVEKGEGGSGAAPTVVNHFSNKEAVKYLGKDIRYLKVGKTKFINTESIFFGSLSYVLTYVVLSVMFIVFSLIYRKQIKENANVALVRTKKANKVAVKRLKQAGNLLKANKKEEFYEEVLRALWGYLSDKLNIPVSNLTKDNVEAELEKYGVQSELSKSFLDLINECEFARYAPSQVSGGMDKLYSDAVEAIEKMEDMIKK